MRFAIVMVLWVAASCKQPAPTSRSKILNIDSLFNAQIDLLANVSIDKTLRVGDSIFNTKALGVKLAHELEAFRELGQINRPIYNSLYETATTPDKQSNLTVREYQTKTNAPIKSLRLFYLNDISQLKRIEAILSTQDIYQTSEKKITLDFTLLGDTLRLESYGISGSQQYFWSVPRHFSINAVLQ
jgi:hypothetical protein